LEEKRTGFEKIIGGVMKVIVSESRHTQYALPKWQRQNRTTSSRW